MVPDRQQVLNFYDRQPASDQLPTGLVKGSDSRAAYTEWFMSAAQGRIVTSRGLTYEGPEEMRAHALYVLERSLMARKKRDAVASQP
jgi:hypothetical protein